MRRIYIATSCIMALKLYWQLFLVPAAAPHLFGSLNRRSMLQAILRCACVREFAAPSAGRSRLLFSAQVSVNNPSVHGDQTSSNHTQGGIAAAILLCALKIASSVSRSSILVCFDHSSRAISPHMHSRLSRPLSEAFSALLCMLLLMYRICPRGIQEGPVILYLGYTNQSGCSI